MKINELARLTGLNAETIRKYRDRGLLRPACNPENGYYEYGRKDFLNLLYIRKLRGANLSLDAIEDTYTSDDAEALLADYRSAIDALEEQIRQLRRRQMMLLISYRHYERDAGHTEEIRQVEAFGTKYDSYFINGPDDPVRQVWVENVGMFTLVVGIDRRYFEQEELPERIPIRMGIGTYEQMLREAGFALPEDVQVFPEGRYVSFFLTVTEVESVAREDLEPVRRYLREHRLRPESGSTAYLFRVDGSGEELRFIFCVRVRVSRIDD